MKVYILIKTFDYADDGYQIIGVFSSLIKIRNFVFNDNEYKTFDYDEKFNRFVKKDENSKFSTFTFLDIYDYDVDIVE